MLTEDFATPGDERLLRPGETCWRLLEADRAAMVVDGAAQFAIARRMILAARRSITLLAWDFDPRVRLRPGDRESLSELLERQVERHPDLVVRVLRWDMPVPLGLRHGMVPLTLRNWVAHPRLHYRLDDALPPGGAQHQKMLIVDGTVAMCGGMDFTGNRWDTSRHAPDDPRRHDPSGSPYEPRHDVALVVSGPVVGGLGAMAAERWRRAVGERIAPPPADPAGDCWPEHLPADFTGVAVGLCRTLPAEDGPAVRENEALHLDSIAAAREAIYLENQYLTAERVAAALQRRLRAEDGPDVCLVLPRQSPSPLEHAVMDPPRADLVTGLRRSDRHGRLGVFRPVNDGGGPIGVHSKVEIVDDRLFRVGSSNLSRRSMGFDPELDLAIEAPQGHPREAEIRAAIRRQRDRLLGEHLGVGARSIAAASARLGMTAAIEHLRNRHGRTLVPLEDGETGAAGGVVSAYHPFDPDGVSEVHRPWRRGPAVPNWLVASAAGMACALVVAVGWTRLRRGP